jgi:serine/threonine-protein kinase RsbW
MSLDTCEWLITDEGAGFDFPHLPDPTDPENILAAHGRGILLSRMQFNVFEYLGSGNCVRLVKNRQLS